MTREEIINSRAYQVSKAALEYYNEHHQDKDINLTDAFEEGAKWADEHSNSNGKELLYVAQKTAERTKKETINNALKFINDYFYEHPNCNCLICTESFESLEEFICDFKKAMDE
jgi:Rad3-related DNA helicase